DEVSRRIKSDSALGQIPVILFTASVAELEHRFKESKADDYLAKPFDPDILLTKVAKLLQK
ncbi:MAG: DNA-binding response regulator, partial [Candidatus Omnitrophica bacterium]|nr:DNA-binding response regulator [Candidatus Omnitrophota bacterium]